MKTIFLIRHQAAGYLTEFIFAEEPTPEQLAPIEKLLVARHGAAHPKTEELYWFKVVEVELITKGAIPKVVLPGASTSNVAGVAGAQVHATGTVSEK